MFTPAMRAICLGLALPLLVTRIRADHQDRTVAADDLALFAHRLYGSSDLHRSGFVSTTGLPHAPGIGRQGATDRPVGRPGKIAGGVLWGMRGDEAGRSPEELRHHACSAVQWGARLRRAT